MASSVDMHLNSFFRYIIRTYKIKAMTQVILIHEHIFRAEGFSPRIASIAKWHGLQRPGLQRALNELESKGLIEQVGEPVFNPNGRPTPNRKISSKVEADAKEWFEKDKEARKKGIKQET